MGMNKWTKRKFCTSTITITTVSMYPDKDSKKVKVKSDGVLWNINKL